MKRTKLKPGQNPMKGATDIFLIQPRDLPNNVPAKLKAWRKAAGLTQEQAAAELGITLRTLENWEQGFSQPLGLSRTALEAELSKRLNAKKRK